MGQPGNETRNDTILLIDSQDKPAVLTSYEYLGVRLCSNYTIVNMQDKMRVKILGVK